MNGGEIHNKKTIFYQFKFRLFEKKLAASDIYKILKKNLHINNICRVDLPTNKSLNSAAD